MKLTETGTNRCTFLKGNSKIMLDGKRIALLVEDGFEDSEFKESLHSMKVADARVVIIGSRARKTYRGKRGNITVKAEADIIM